MKERILENKRNFSTRKFTDMAGNLKPNILEPTKKVVANVINGNTFETTDNQFIQIKGVYIPEKDHKGYAQALADLKSILKQNSTVKVFPVKIDDMGKIMAKVKIKTKDISNIMKKKGWSDASVTLKTEKKSREKHRW